EEHNLWHYLERIDILSGIGHYGVLLIGLDDGMELDQPAAGLNERGEPLPNRPQRKITFLRCFDESLAKVESYETDVTNPRFGQPRFYNLTFADTRAVSVIQGNTLSVTKRVHWSRVVHIADNRTTSEIVGTPRMKDVFNYLYDLSKILGGSAEMFWKGGF